MSAELFSALAGAFLSLALSYIPGLNDLWEQLASAQKRAIMGLLLVTVTVGAYIGACQGYWSGTCGNWQGYVEALLAALVANQSIYKITKG